MVLAAVARGDFAQAEGRSQHDEAVLPWAAATRDQVDRAADGIESDLDRRQAAVNLDSFDAIDR